MPIHIAHSPDSDDAFMFYALAQHKIDAEGLEFEHVLRDIETLNREALKGTYEISAVSIHAYAYLADKYALLGSGASMGENYGPMIIGLPERTMGDLSGGGPPPERTLRPAKGSTAGGGRQGRTHCFPSEQVTHCSPSEFIKGKKIAIPGKLTSAYLALQMLESDFEPVTVPFDQIIDCVLRKEVDAGLIIHEGQLQYQEMGLSLVVDLGKWWFEKSGLPLPLGGNAVRRDLGPEMMKKLARIQKASIAYGLDHRNDALSHSMQYARDLPREKADRFVGMYVNQRTLDYGIDGKKAVRVFLDLAYQKKLIPHPVSVEFIE